MKLIRLSLACLVVSLLSSVGWATKYPGLKVIGNYKQLVFLVEGFDVNRAGLTKEDVEKAVKIRLLFHDIIPIRFQDLMAAQQYATHNIYINVSITNAPAFVSPPAVVYNIKVELNKYSFAYGVSVKAAGQMFAPRQGGYATTGISGVGSKAFIIAHLNGIIDKFVLDYREANIE